MTDYNDGNWHGWNGGGCPVHQESVVDWVSPGELRNFELVKVQPLAASSLDWSYIIAFRVVTPYVEPPKPRECWINEYPSGTMAVHMDAWTAETRRADYAKTTRWIEVLE